MLVEVVRALVVVPAGVMEVAAAAAIVEQRASPQKKGEKNFVVSVLACDTLCR